MKKMVNTLFAMVMFMFVIGSINHFGNGIVDYFNLYNNKALVFVFGEVILTGVLHGLILGLWSENYKRA